MKMFPRVLALTMAFAACTFLASNASADEWNKKTTVTFNAPVEVPGTNPQVLPAGTYVFQLVDSNSNRHIVRITDESGLKVYTTILAIPNYRLTATDKTVMTFKERAEGQPEAIRAWFYPNRNGGDEFVYPKTKALELAKISNEPVLYTPVEVITPEQLKTAPVAAVKPTGEAIDVAEVVQPPPQEVASLPKTASDLPLLALCGLLSLGAAAVMTKYTARRQKV
jgi:hypothetical protein